MGFQGEHLQSVATDDNHCIEIKASVLYLLTPENIIRRNIEMSAADVKELFTGKLVNQRRLEIQSSVKKHNIGKPASNSLIASVWPSLWQPS